VGLVRSDNPILPPRRVEPEEDPFDIIEEQAQGESPSTVGYHTPATSPWRTMVEPVWDEVAESDGKFVLLHNGKLYAAAPIDTDDVVNRAFNRA